MEAGLEGLASDWALPAAFAGLALLAWLLIVARQADRARDLVKLCREAVRIREGQERLQAAGKPAPFLVQTRRAEVELRDLLRRRGLA